MHTTPLYYNISKLRIGSSLYATSLSQHYNPSDPTTVSASHSLHAYGVKPQQPGTAPVPHGPAPLIPVQRMHWARRVGSCGSLERDFDGKRSSGMLRYRSLLCHRSSACRGNTKLGWGKRDCSAGLARWQMWYEDIEFEELLGVSIS